MQTLGPDPKRIELSTGQLTASQQVNLPVFPANPGVFRIRTSIAVDFPAIAATFEASGRTGPSTATFCAGRSLGSPASPVCLAPNDAGNTIHGLIRYVRTANQFGGPARAAFAGDVQLAIRVASPAPCTAIVSGMVVNPGCQVIYASTSPAPNGLIGAPFGASTVRSGATPPSPGGRRYANISGAGSILSVTSPGLGPGLPNPVTSFGGPWTTGMITISVTAAIGPPQIFMITGSDNRVDGAGSISLVAGAISARTLTGPNAHRGWLNLTLVPEPSRWLILAAGISWLIALRRCRRRPSEPR